MIECILCLALSAYHSTYDETIRSDWGAQVSMGDPLSVFVSYEAPSYKSLGQNMGDINLIGAGASYRWEWFYVELGHYWTDASPDQNIMEEVVDQRLRNDHGSPGVSWEHFEYSLGSGWGGAVGVSGSLTERLRAFAGYRFLKVSEDFDACIGPGPGCVYGREERHWQERNTLSLSGFQIGVTLLLR